MTRKQLFKKIDEARREYIRKRDADFSGFVKCISCTVVRPVDEMDCGHYYSRVHDWSSLLGGDEKNVNLQCVPCNSFKRGNPRGYVIGLIKKYGKDVIIELHKKKNISKYWKIKELQELLDYFKRI